jgi:chromosomal replication initiator protein
MHDAIWDKARRRLCAELPAKDYDTWIAPLRATIGTNGEFTVEAPSTFGLDWVRAHHLEGVTRAVEEAAGEPVRLKLVVNRSLEVPTPERRTVRRAELAAKPAKAERAGPVSRCTFDSFVVGETNHVAYEAARAIVSEPGLRYNPLFVYGGTGLGKTHLLTATAEAVAQGNGATPGVLYVTAESFVNELIAALKRHQMERFRHRFRRIGTLIIDDIQFLGDKKRSQEEFTHTFNTLHDGRKQIVVASDRPPHELPGFEEALRNRFSCGLLADIKPPDAALRLALVGRKAAEAGLTLDGEVTAHLAEHWCSNGRQLEGVLRRIEAFSQLAGKPITLALVREALAPFRTVADGRKSVGRIVGEVCRQFQVSRSELVSAARTARLTLPRHVAMYLCRRHTDAPLGAIGKELGGRDHSTVVHALGAIETRLQRDAELRATVSLLEARLGG